MTAIAKINTPHKNTSPQVHNQFRKTNNKRSHQNQPNTSNKNKKNPPNHPHMHHQHPANRQSHFQTPDEYTKKLPKKILKKITKKILKRLQDRYLEENRTGINQKLEKNDDSEPRIQKKNGISRSAENASTSRPLGGLFSSQKKKVGPRRREGGRGRTPPPVVSPAAVAGVSRRRRYGR